MKIMKSLFVVMAIGAAFTLCSPVSHAAVVKPAKVAKVKAPKAKKVNVNGKLHGVPRVAPATPAPAAAAPAL
jgi:hypothetical protein